MTITFSPFKSDNGFSSPGFLVSPTGNITTSGQLSVDDLLINGVPILETDDSTVSLSTLIKNSSLTALGRLDFLNITGDLEVTDIDSNTNIEIVNGKVTITSTEVGNIDNINIGQTIAGQAAFTELTAADSNFDVATVNQLTATSATATDADINNLSSNNITINNQPTSLFHATRKDYVDNRTAALSIALGA